MKRKTARAIIIKDKKFILIHRIKEVNEQQIEYYTFPGGGLEGKETYEQAVIREIHEEIGIKVKPQKRIYHLELEDREEMFILCEYIEGIIGTGKGPEYTESIYTKNGQYNIELISMDKFKEINILEPVKQFIMENVIS